MTELLEQLKARQFEDLKGTILNLEIPIDEDLLNKFLNENIQHELIRSASADIGYHNNWTILSINLHMTVRLPPFFRKKDFTVAIRFRLPSSWGQHASNAAIDPWKQTTIAQLESISTLELKGMNEKIVIGQVRRVMMDNLPDQLFLNNDEVVMLLRDTLKKNKLEFVLDYIQNNRIEIRSGDHKFFVVTTLEI